MLPSGIYPATVTPFDDADRIDETSLSSLFEHFEDAGVTGVVLAGTNGEGPSLSLDEKLELVQNARARTSLPLILGVATQSLAEAKEIARRAGPAGAQALLLMPPSYFKDVKEEGLLAWFAAVAKETSCPLLVYHHPRATGVSLSMDLLRALSELPEVWGVKDSSADSDLAATRSAVPDEKRLFVGDETRLFSALDEGWDGTISGAANVIAANLVRATEERDTRLFESLLPTIELLRAASQPATNKMLLSSRGLIRSPGCRLPLLRAKPEDIDPRLMAALSAG